MAALLDGIPFVMSAKNLNLVCPRNSYFSPSAENLNKSTDECNRASMELACDIKDEIARKKLEMDTLEARCKESEQNCAQQKSDRLGELQKVHEEQLRSLTDGQVAAAKEKLPDATKCKDCANLVYTNAAPWKKKHDAQSEASSVVLNLVCQIQIRFQISLFDWRDGAGPG